MRYSLTTTAIHQLDMEKIQQQATAAFLSTMGFNRNMPREVVFGHKTHQGLGLRHLFDMQGIDGTIALIQELNSNSATTEILMATIQTIQLKAGISKNIFEGTTPLAHVSWSWLMSVRDFLHHMKAEIRGIPIVITPQYRANDKHIMEIAINSCHRYTMKDLQLIQACRVHMQVTVLSEITDSTGEQIKDEWLYPHKKRAESNWKWPRQPSPGRTAWQTWRRFIKTEFTNDLYRLHKPLGPWRTVPHRHYHHLYEHTNKTLFFRTQDNWDTHTLARSRRRSLEFNMQAQPTVSTPPQDAIPIDVIRIDNNKNIITTIPSRIEQKTMESKSQLDCVSAYIINNYPRYQHLHQCFEWILDDISISEHFSGYQTTHLATDGGYEPATGISTYGWVIASPEAIIATGRGPAEAHPTLANSFRAEGYGAASALLFVIAYLEAHRIPIAHKSWKLHIDNKSMVDRLTEYTKLRKRKAKHQTRLEVDITNIADELLRKLSNVQVLHIKSHQDDITPADKLTWPARLNIIADNQATLQREAMDSPAATVTNTTMGMLHITEMAITRNADQILWRMASRIPLQDYYNTRNGWSNSTFQLINWEAQHAALL
jgi:ribonuclease HI